MTGAIPGGVDGVGRLLIVASKKVGGESGDEGIRWVFLYFDLSLEIEMIKWHKSSILLK